MMFYLVRTNQLKQGAEVLDQGESRVALKNKMYELSEADTSSSKYFVTDSDEFYPPFDTLKSESIVEWP